MSAGDDLVDKIVGVTFAKRSNNALRKSTAMLISKEEAIQLTTKTQEELDKRFFIEHADIVNDLSACILAAATKAQNFCLFGYTVEREKHKNTIFSILKKANYKVELTYSGVEIFW